MVERGEPHRNPADPAPEQQQHGGQTEAVADREHRVDLSELQFDGDPG